MITALYAGILAIFYVALTAFVVQGRYAYKVGLGDGGVPALTQRIRIHGNFAEYVPFGLMLLFLVDYAGYSAWLVHLLGIMLVTGRIAHAWGVYCSPVASPGRLAGMILTILMFIIAAGFLLVEYLSVA